MTHPAVTSKRVAAIAGRVLEMPVPYDKLSVVAVWHEGRQHIIEWSDIRALAASALRQTEQDSQRSPTPRQPVRRPRAKNGGTKSKRTCK
jgi:hypothetical protein